MNPITEFLSTMSEETKDNTNTTQSTFSLQRSPADNCTTTFSHPCTPNDTGPHALPPENSPLRLYLVGSAVAQHSGLLNALNLWTQQENNIEIIVVTDSDAHSLNFTIVPFSRTPPSYLDHNEPPSHSSFPQYLYILAAFEGKLYDHLKDSGCKIFGPTCVIDLLTKSYPLTSLKLGSVYTLSLNKAIIAFSGFERDRKYELNRLTLLAHYMGARVKAEMTKSVTHLVACDVKSTFYRDSVGLAVDALSVDWLKYCWDNRDHPLFCGTDTHVTKNFRIKPFTGLCLAFYGFASQELKHMEEVALTNGAATTDVSSSSVTHIVVDEAASSDFFLTPKESVWVVTSQWFWKCVQLQLYTLEEPYSAPLLEVKKKKLPKEDISPNVHNLRGPHSPKRSPLSALFNIRRKSHEKSSAFASTQCVSKRSHNFMELLHTERNYADVLRTLLEVFKIPLEVGLSDKYGPIMSSEDIKIVFGAIPDICKLHVDLATELEALATSWSETSMIGPTFDRYIDAFLKSYPLFINYFEIIKETVSRVDSENQRFHAFLKVCLVNPRCNRQSLCELLIRPVQRLPSIILLLKELLKHTPHCNPDFAYVERAIDSLTFVLNQINEDKRKTEEQLQMVEVYNNIESCPAYVLSSQRHFVMKLDATELQEFTKTKGRQVTLFILSDSVEIAKKRQGRIFGPSTTSPNIKPSPSISSLHKTKTHKHCTFLAFKQIDHVIDVPESTHSVWRNVFGLCYRPTDGDEMVVTCFYRVLGERAPLLKQEAISLLMKSIACAKSLLDSEIFERTDSNSFFKRSDSPLRSIGKAIEQLAIKTSRRMSRAFSIKNKNEFLPRSISVTSQIPSDMFSNSLSLHRRKVRKSVQVDSNASASVNLDVNSEIIVGVQSPAMSLDLSKKPSILAEPKRFNKKKISLWRRSVQAEEISKR